MGLLNEYKFMRQRRHVRRAIYPYFKLKMLIALTTASQLLIMLPIFIVGLIGLAFQGLGFLMTEYPKRLADVLKDHVPPYSTFANAMHSMEKRRENFARDVTHMIRKRETKILKKKRVD